MTSDAVAARPRSRYRLAWFGVLAPPLAFATQLVVGYGLQEAGCGRPDSDLWGAGLDGLTAVVIVVCAVITLAGGIASVVAWRAADRGDARGTLRFMATAGVASSFTFLIAIVLSGIAFFPLSSCNPG
jgi:cytochrome bd-type quinol oxidase subunit 2